MSKRMEKQEKVDNSLVKEGSVLDLKLFAFLNYAGGFLDGEGCFKITTRLRNGKRYFEGQAMVCNTKISFLKELKKYFPYGHLYKGRYYSNRPNHQKCHTFNITGQNNLLVFLKTIIPYLKQKKKVAQIVKKFVHLQQINPHDPKLLDLFEKARFENRRGLNAIQT